MATAKLVWMGGTDVSDAAQELVDAVAGGAEAAEGSFNDVVLRAVKGTTASEIVTAYHAGLEAQSKAYEASPQGRAAKAKAIIEKQSSQEQADALMVELQTLDFSSDVAVLNWLRRFVDPSDHIGIQVDKGAVVKAFADHGYFASVNCGDDYREDDRDNSARWLIGQALDGLRMIGAIHGVFYRFHEEWKTKFLTRAA